MSSFPLAPIRVFISYSHDSPEHMDRVLSLADRLREDGVDAAIDQYVTAPPEGWPEWTRQQISEAQFVLVVCTKTYLRRFERKEDPGKGHGVTWEGSVLSQEIYEAATTNTKFIPVLLDGAEPTDIPGPLRPTTRYRCTNDEEYEQLYRRITDQPAVKMPVLGKPRSLPPRQRQPLATKPTKPWNVPHDRNPVFTGREEILNQLRADLLKNGRQALSGLGGIGKTQIAVEYAYRYRDEYDAVLWTFADSEQSVITGFANIARQLELPEKESAEQATVINAVKRWLQENEKWLLVFDNADTPGILAPYLPQQPKGHVLLTSRAHVFQSLGILKPLEISVLSPTAAVEFLLKRTSREGTAESSEVEILAKELGYLPLALEQAAAYIVENQSSFKDYLASYKKQRLKLLEKQGPALGNPQEQQKRTVASAWAVNFESVEKDSPASADLLRLSAFLAPDAIPLELQEKGRAQMGERLTPILAKVADDPLVVDELLKPLISYSLVRRSPETRSFSIHPLVQEVIMEGMSEDAKRSWAETAVKVLNSAFPDIEFQNWPDCDRLLPHSMVCAGLIEKYGLEFAAAAGLLNQTAYYLKERAQYGQVEQLYLRSLGIYEIAVGREHPDTAASLNNLALLYKTQGKYAEAEPLFQRSLAIFEKALGPGHDHTAAALNNLAGLYDDQGRYTEAESLYQRSLAIREKVLGAEHPDTAGSLNNLGGLYMTQGKYTEAEPLYQRSSAILEKVLGPEHPNTAMSLNNLAVLYDKQGRYTEAELLYQLSLAIEEKVLGPEHPETAKSLNNLAALYGDQGRYTEAEPLYRRAVDAAQKALGLKHPYTEVYAKNLISCYRAQGKVKEAEELEQQMGKST